MESEMPQNNVNSDNTMAKTDSFNAENELADIALIFWKWKYIILAGTIVFTLVAAYLTLAKPIRFRATSVIEFIPVVMTDGLHKSVKDMAISKKIKSDIEMGLYDGKMIEYLNSVESTSIKKLPKVKIGYLGDKKYLKFSCVSRDPKLGVRVLNALIQVLKNRFILDIKTLQNDYIHQKRSEIQLFKIHIDQANNDIKIFSNRIKELDSEIKKLNGKIDLLMRMKNQNSMNMKESGSQELIIQDNMITHNKALLNDYNKELFQFSLETENRKFKIKESELKIRSHEKEIVLFKEKVNINQFINILKLPENNIQTVKGKAKLKIVLGGIVGFLFMIFLAFLLDYFTRSTAQKSNI